MSKPYAVFKNNHMPNSMEKFICSKLCKSFAVKKFAADFFTDLPREIGFGRSPGMELLRASPSDEIETPTGIKAISQQHFTQTVVSPEHVIIIVE